MSAAAQLKDPALHVVEKEILFDRMLVFSGFPETNSVHTSRPAAVERGLPNAIAQGLQMYAYMLEWLTGYFGDDWYDGGRLAVSFIGLVVPGDHLTVRATLKDTEPVEGGVRATLEVWCENHRGQTVAAGTASAVAR
jgi:acyl dehydratase